MTMSWDKVAVPFKVCGQRQRGGRGQSAKADAWAVAVHVGRLGRCCDLLVDNKMDLNEALKDEDKSIQNEERFENLMTKSRILDAMGQTTEATAARDKALAMGNAPQLYGYGRQLQRERQAERSLRASINRPRRKYPDNWLSHAGLARIYCGEGNYDDATKQMEMALAGAPDPAKTGVQGLIKRLQVEAGHQPVRPGPRFRPQQRYGCCGCHTSP